MSQELFPSVMKRVFTAMFMRFCNRLLPVAAYQRLSLVFAQTPVRAPARTSVATIMAKRSKSSNQQSNNNGIKSTGRDGPWSTYEDLHGEVSEQLVQAGIRNPEFLPPPEDDAEVENSWSSNIMGRFDCANKACTSRGWGSKVIPIMIYYLKGQGCRYSAQVFHQRCKKCNEVGVCHINTETYVERVVYWVKMWEDKPVKQPVHSKRRGLLKHRSDLCLGCAQGRCRAGRIKGKRIIADLFE